MMCVSRSWIDWIWSAGIIFCLAGWAGCRPAIESTPEALSLPLLERDPAEDGRQIRCWPSWRGTNGSGIARGGNPATDFSATEGFRWKVAVPGEGHSSPVVWDDFVLLTSAIGTSDPPTLAILCLDRSDGRLLWRSDVGAATGSTHNKNGYASASVATDGQRIYAFFGTTGLFCYDFSGERLWRADLGDLGHKWGTAASPVLFGDLVIQLCDSQHDSYVAGFSRLDGHEVWRTPRISDGCWTTPVFVDVNDEGVQRTEMVVNGTGRRNDDERMVIAYDPCDGRQLWQVRGTTEFATPTILVTAGLVYSTTGRNGPIMAIRPGGSGDVTGTRVVWKLRRGGPYIPSGVAYRNRLFLVSDVGDVTCYNAGSGQLIWKHRLRGPFSASLVAADGRLYAVNERGIVYVFAATDSFVLLAQNDMGDACQATPAVANGELFIRTRQSLYCIPADG